MRKIFSLLFVALFVLAPQVSNAATTGIAAKPVRVLVKALSTSNLTLSGAQTIDSVAVVAGDLVGAVGQSDNHNAVYLVQSGAWKVADPGFGTGLEIYALAGGSNANKVYGADTTGAITWGSTAVTFTLKSSGGGAISGATVVASTSVQSPVYNVTESAGPVQTAGMTKIFSSNALSGSNLALKGASGDTLFLQFPSGSGTSSASKRFYVKTLGDDATFDVTVAGGGHGVVTAIAAGASSSCAFSFSDNGTTSDNGLTGTNCAVADTDTKFCAYQGASGHVIFKNRLGSSMKVAIELFEAVAP